MFTKHKFKLEMFVAVYWNYGKCCISIDRGTILFVELSVISETLLL